MKQILIFLLLTLSGLDCFSQTQLDTNSKAASEFKKSNNELNRVYKQILFEYKSDSLFIDNLKKSQRIWIDFRDAELEMKFPKNIDTVGTIEPMCRTLYFTELTTQRTETLKKWLNSDTDENICYGSIRTWDMDTSGNITGASIEENGEVSIIANMNRDHRIMGYAKPDKSSNKMIFFSVFTNDVENNPSNCKYGSYYDTNGLKDIKLIYKSTIGYFVELEIVKNGKSIDKVYIEKKWFD